MGTDYPIGFYPRDQGGIETGDTGPMISDKKLNKMIFDHNVRPQNKACEFIAVVE